MTDFLTDIYGKILEIVNAVGGTLDSLVTQLDSVEFTESSTITKSMGLVRYFVETPLYLMFTTLVQIGAGFILFKLIKIVVNAIANVIPGLKGRIRIE